jgi:hypothetical protein
LVFFYKLTTTTDEYALGIRSFFDAIATRFGIQKQEDWYKFEFRQIKKLEGVSRLTKRHGNVLNALEIGYPGISSSDFTYHHLISLIKTFCGMDGYFQNHLVGINQKKTTERYPVIQ